MTVFLLPLPLLLLLLLLMRHREGECAFLKLTCADCMQLMCASLFFSSSFDNDIDQFRDCRLFGFILIGIVVWYRHYILIVNNNDRERKNESKSLITFGMFSVHTHTEFQFSPFLSLSLFLSHTHNFNTGFNDVLMRALWFYQGKIRQPI